MEDVVEKIQGSLIQHGRHNDRIYVLRLNSGSPQRLISRLERIAEVSDYGKICAKISAPSWKAFEDAGFVREAVVPGFFRGDIDGYFVAKYPDAERQTEAHDVGSPADNRAGGNANGHRLGSNADAAEEIVACRPQDAAEMSAAYRQVFETYPFPIHRPQFIERMMAAGNLYFCIRVRGKMVALAASEIDFSNQNVEMTDFATLPKWRAMGLAGRLLRHMEDKTRLLGIKTAYTIARAASPGMNAVLKSNGYRYAGMLKNNSQICGSIQSMTVWYKHLQN